MFYSSQVIFSKLDSPHITYTCPTKSCHCVAIKGVDLRVNIAAIPECSFTGIIIRFENFISIPAMRLSSPSVIPEFDDMSARSAG